MYERDSFAHEIPASSGQLGELALNTRSWLEREGKLIIELTGGRSREHGLYDEGKYQGLPLTEGLPYKFFSASGDAVRQVAPAAAETLEVGNSLEFRYELPHFEPLVQWDIVGKDNVSGLISWYTGKKEYFPPHFIFWIEKNPGLSITDDCLMVEFDEDQGEWKSNRISESVVPFSFTQAQLERIENAESGTEALTESLRARGADYAFNKAMGTNLITHREFAALLDIVARLDEIKAIETAHA